MSGWLSYLQFAREATYGTAPTITKRIQARVLGPGALRGVVKPGFLDGTFLRPIFKSGPRLSRPKIEIPVTYNTFGLWWDLLMGTDTYGANGGATTGPVSGIYTHSWTNFKPICNSHAFEFGMADIPTGKCERVLGFKPTRATFRSQASLDGEEQFLILALEGTGRPVEPNTSRTAGLSVVDTSYVQHHHIITADTVSGTTAPRTLDFELSIDLMMKERLFAEGSGLYSEPKRNGRPFCRLSIREEFQSDDALEAYLANTLYNHSIVFSDGGTPDKSISFTFAGQLVEPPVHDISDESIPTQQFTVESSNNGSTALAIVVENENATIQA